MIKMIVAHDNLSGIGYKNELLFHIKKDLQRFKKLTEGHVVIMGRKTHESLPVDILPHRINVVLTRDKDYKPRNSNVIVMHDIETILNHYENGKQDKDIFIIGGSKLYDEFIEYADVVYITSIHAYKKADTYLHIYDELDKDFTPYKTETHVTEDNKNIMYQFIDYVRDSELFNYHEKVKENDCEL